MIKNIIIIFLIFIILVCAGVIYLNKAILPVKIKSLIVATLQEQTDKKVTLKDVRLNIFKGIVLRDLKIFDDSETILNLKEGSCTFLIWPFFKKQIIIPTLNFKAPEIFLERRADNTLNIQEFFKQKKPQNSKPKFALYIYKISVNAGRIIFKDNAIAPSLVKTAENINLIAYLSLPTGIKFNFKLQIKDTIPIKIISRGQYDIAKKELISQLSVKDFPPGEFTRYFKNLRPLVQAGLLDAEAGIIFKDNSLAAEIVLLTKELNFSNGNTNFKLNSSLKTDIKYNFVDKKWSLAGRADIARLDVSGLDFVDKIDDLCGEIKFDNFGLSTEKLTANILGFPVVAKAKLTNFRNPLLNINLSSDLDLNSLKTVLQERLKSSFPAISIQGDAGLLLDLETKIPIKDSLRINGNLDITNTSLKFEKSVFAPINGKIKFTEKSFDWSTLAFKYLGQDFITSGVVTNFKNPNVQFQLESKDLWLKALFGVQEKIIDLSEFYAKYLDSKLSLLGKIDISNSANIQADLTGSSEINLSDFKKIAKIKKEAIEKINPEGNLELKIGISGKINDFRACSVNAGCFGPSISLYGFKLADFYMNYNQADGAIDITNLHSSLYGGILQASAKIDMNQKDFPYWAIIDIAGVKLEDLKADTAMKNDDVAGKLSLRIKADGLLNDFSRLSGKGEIFVSDGKLWQFNLFKGIGKLLFTTDFTKVVFSEGYCAFKIFDKQIMTDNIKLKSNLADITGSFKLGFDKSIDGALNVQVTPEAPLTGTFKDVTTAILGQVERLAVIRITGSLSEPKYQLQADVGGIINSLKNIFWKKE